MTTVITLIILIFVARSVVSGLAYATLHCVLGLSLPPSNANILFIAISGLPVLRRRASEDPLSADDREELDFQQSNVPSMLKIGNACNLCRLFVYRFRPPNSHCKWRADKYLRSGMGTILVDIYRTIFEAGNIDI